MSFNITERARSLVSSGVIQPVLVCQIEGYDKLLTSVTISEVARFGDPALFFGKPGLLFGGMVGKDNQEDLISLALSTNTVTQQILATEGAASSVSQMTIGLVNKDNAFSDLVTPETTRDIISSQATIYLGVDGMSFPEDFITLFVGNVSEITTSAGTVLVKVSHPENAKRAEVFLKISTELTANIIAGATTIPVQSTAGMLLPNDCFRTMVRIEDELIEYTGLTANSITGITRAALGTVADSHDLETEVSTFYVLGDGTPDSNAITLALKVLLSGGGAFGESTIDSFGTSPNPETQNSIFIKDELLQTYQNLMVGDYVTITGAAGPGNNKTLAQIKDVTETPDGTRVTILEPLTIEGDGATATFHSQYDVLPSGIGLNPSQVDVPEFLNIYRLFSSSIPNYMLYIRDTMTGSDLLNKEILFPSAAYSIPRKGKVSLGKTKPPISSFDTKILDENTVINASDLKIERSSLTNFYNVSLFEFDEDVLEEGRFLANRITLSAASSNRIKKVGNKVYRVSSKGLRKTNDNEKIIEINSLRILDRYQYGAESIKGIKVNFQTGFNMEVGDTVIIQGLQLFDSKTGDRGLSPRIMEVNNKSFNFRTGSIVLDLLDTSFSAAGRYGVISPSSVIGAGSTAEGLYLVKSFGTTELQKEQFKWTSLVGQQVLVHSEDWTVQGLATFKGFSPSNDSLMLIDGLPFTPMPGYIVDIPHYDDAAAIHKSIYGFFNPHERVTANASNDTSFITTHPERYFVGSIVLVHNKDWSIRSPEVRVVGISGSVITVDEGLGFNAALDFEVEFIGFVSDNGLPYRLL